jgi:hypothetical protein
MCGKNIKPVPLSTSAATQIILYLKALLLPPFGIVWGLRYLRQSGNRTKIVGIIVIILTLIELVWLVQSTVYTINTVNQQINQQFKL